MRLMTRLAAFEPAAWGSQEVTEVAELFDGLAPEWHTRASEPRLEVISDAFERGGPGGGPIPPGRWLELGSGSGLLTGWLAQRATSVVAVDLSAQMLALAPAGPSARLRADGACLPFRSGVFDALVLVNAFLFPAEAGRVLAGHGAVVFVSTSGPGTPIYLSAADVLAALGEGWTAVAAEAGWGTWCVARRARPER